MISRKMVKFTNQTVITLFEIFTKNHTQEGVFNNNQIVNCKFTILTEHLLTTDRTQVLKTNI